MSLLEVQDLHTSFFTDAGEVKAVNGVSFFLDKGKARGDDAGGALRILARRALALHPLQRVPQRMSGVLVRKMRV